MSVRSDELFKIFQNARKVRPESFSIITGPSFVWWASQANIENVNHTEKDGSITWIYNFAVDPQSGMLFVDQLQLGTQIHHFWEGKMNWRSPGVYPFMFDMLRQIEVKAIENKLSPIVLSNNVSPSDYFNQGGAPESLNDVAAEIARYQNPIAIYMSVCLYRPSNQPIVGGTQIAVAVGGLIRSYMQSRIPASTRLTVTPKFADYIGPPNSLGRVEIQVAY